MVFNRGTLPLGGVNEFKVGREPLRALQHGKFNLLNLPINNICFYSLFKVRGLEEKNN